MSRFTAPRLKVMRSLGLDLPGLSRKSIEQRPHPPGQHGARQMRRKSDFGLQLSEKQKLRMNYGLTERQMRKLMQEAKKHRGNSGEKLLELLERRFDNVVFRAGYAPTIPAARQLVSHGHLHVNGRPVDIPSYRLRIGDVVTLREKSRNLFIIRSSVDNPSLTRPEWLRWDENNLAVSVSHLPAASDVPFPIELQLVVEYYAQRL